MTYQQKYLSSSVLAITAFGAFLLCNPSQGLAISLGTELASFAVLGASTVTNTGPTTLTGNLGVFSGSAITGFFGTVENDGPGTFSGAPHQADAFAGLAHDQLITAKSDLAALGFGTEIGANLTGATLTPGVYSFTGGAALLAGTVTLDGQGDPNALWVFQIASTLTTISGSTVNFINGGTGSQLYWNVGSSATLGTTTTFAGDILAYANITMLDGATINCGRALAQVEAVNLHNNNIGNACAPGNGGGGDRGGNGGKVPEPATLLLLGSGLVGLAAWRWKQAA